jgi:phage terminase small subunit
MKTRRTKATTVDGAVKGMQNALKPLPEPPWPLSAAAKRVWEKILVRRSGDEWRAIDYEFAWELAELTVRLREEEKRLAKEGTVIDSERGPKTNPRHGIVNTMSKRRINLAIYLRVHPGSEAVYAHQVAGPRQAERAARAMIERPADFLAKH